MFKRCAMHSRVDEENSDWIVRCTLASVSTSTLLVASSYINENIHVKSHSFRHDEGLTRTMMRLFFTNARQSANSCFSPAL